MKKNKTYTNVVKILGENSPSNMTGVTPRDSDRELLIQYMQRILGARLNATQLTLIRSINFESITRCRRKLQENGEYLPSPEIARKRKLKGSVVERVAPKETAEGLQRRIESNA